MLEKVDGDQIDRERQVPVMGISDEYGGSAESVYTKAMSLVTSVDGD